MPANGRWYLIRRLKDKAKCNWERCTKYLVGEEEVLLRLLGASRLVQLDQRYFGLVIKVERTAHCNKSGVSLRKYLYYTATLCVLGS